MPFKSKAQRRKFAQLLVEGRISDETYEEWNRSTGKKELPERVTKAKPAAKAKPATKAKRAATRSSRVRKVATSAAARKK
jgi:hypothetical protein